MSRKLLYVVCSPHKAIYWEMLKSNASDFILKRAIKSMIKLKLMVYLNSIDVSCFVQRLIKICVLALFLLSISKNSITISNNPEKRLLKFSRIYFAVVLQFNNLDISMFLDPVK